MNYFNRRISITATSIGILLGMAGILNHGIFEILQGNTVTNGFYIEAIGESHRYWLYGTEGAFTLIHNFLATGIAAVLVGLTVVLWSVKYLHKRNGAIIFMLLLILLTLVGGGIGHIVLFFPAWAFATLIRRSPEWWRRIFSVRWLKIASSLWIYSLLATIVSWLIVMELGVFGYFPGSGDPDSILNIVFFFLFSTVILACVSFICAIAGDIREREGITPSAG